MVLQVLYSVRHGESTFNAASATSRSFEDPVIYDAILTDRGRSQVHVYKPVTLLRLRLLLILLLLLLKNILILYCMANIAITSTASLGNAD